MSTVHIPSTIEELDTSDEPDQGGFVVRFADGELFTKAE